MTQPSFRTLRPLVGHAVLAVLLLQGVLPIAAHAGQQDTNGDPTRPGRGLQRLDGGGAPPPRDTVSRDEDGRPTRPGRGLQRLDGGGAPPPRDTVSRDEDGHPTRPGRGLQRLDDAPGADGPRRFSWKAPNGFTIDVEARPAPGGGHTASAVLRDAGGETMTFEFLPASEAGPVVLIDDSILVAYDLADDGRVRGVLADDGFRAAKTSRSRQRPERAVDDGAYRVLLDGLLRNHSPEFLAAMQVAMADLGAGAVAPAGVRQVIECVLAVTGYVLSVWSLVAGCTAAGFATVGASCILAIFAHELAVASAIVSCLP